MSMWMMRRGAVALPYLCGEVAQPCGERAEQGLGEVRAELDEGEEGLAVDRQQRAVGLGHGIGNARGGRMDEGRLAEHAARAEALDDLAADRDPDSALEHCVHAQSLLALGHDR